MSVNMFRWRFTIDCQPRTKNGQPPQRTTGVARRSSSQPIVMGSTRINAANDSDIASTNSGTVSTALTQNRRVMSISSWSGSSSAAGVIRSSAMPQIGQLPGWSRTTSGCMGHVHFTPDVLVGGSGFGWGARGVGGTWWGGGADKYRSGVSPNFLAQPAPQKKYRRPS